MAPIHGGTPFSEIDSIHKELNDSFVASALSALGKAPSVKSTSPYPLLSIQYRVHQLRQLAILIQENTDAFCEALDKDFGKPAREILMGELGPAFERTLQSAKDVESWAKTTPAEGVPEWQSTWGARVEKRAKGVVLIISPWNYPIILTFQPLIGAIAAGCCAVIKPSEIIPTFSTLIAELVPKYLDPAAYRVVLGAVPEITRLLELKWDHIFYTGNGRVGRIIASAAAKHLTPITLELGGKSPVIVDPATCGDLALAAKRIIWGKINNAGQICIAPDYVLIPRASIPAFTAAVSKALAEFFPDGALNSKDYGRIVSPLHFNRVKALLSRTTGKIVVGGKTGRGGEHAVDRVVEPTLIVFDDIEVGAKDITMEEELFAPLLPVIPVDSIADALAFVRARDHPLVIYAFTNDDKLKQTILDSTLSGNTVFNDTFQQLSVDQIPFGGVGESGYGRQVLKYTFDEFAYQRSVLDIPQKAEPSLTIRYPPTTEKNLSFFSGFRKTVVPTAGPGVHAGLKGSNGTEWNGEHHPHVHADGPTNLGTLGAVGNTVGGLGVL
ncbi:aldehyde dehydrogenase [Coprinopsis marcescibilis]|uniref:Aldehyde dehydrogenase n=1 Tax=Coprinopsis marcescibilis TaxID=230819 RepID=A0A5C3KM22_COPMA|nr:aldehyde dehydrogenase [Coprinopsis marcescibilis]